MKHIKNYKLFLESYEDIMKNISDEVDINVIEKTKKELETIKEKIQGKKLDLETQLEKLEKLEVETFTEENKKIVENKQKEIKDIIEKLKTDIIQYEKDVDDIKLKISKLSGKKINENLKKTDDGVFWGNIGGGVLPICKKTKRALIAYRSKYVQEPNTWGVWGGKIDEENGESETDIEEVVKREFNEECGYDGDIRLIPSYVFKTSDNRFTYYNFIGLIDEEFEPKLDWETEDYIWLTFAELIDLSPKHFGLKKLIENDILTIKKYLYQNDKEV